MKSLILILATTLALSNHWKEKADERIETIRKGDFVVTILLPNSKPAADQLVHVRQTRHFFKFGVSLDSRYIGQDTDSSKKYEKFVTELFNAAVCEQEMTWRYVEPSSNETNFADADKLLSFAEKNKMSMRGHSLLQGNKEKIQMWLQLLTTDEIKNAINRHLEMMVARYKNRVSCWDVENEMLDGFFFTNTLGENIRADFFKKVGKLDPLVPLFTNEYGILEDDSKTANYIYLIRQLQEQGVKIDGIGIEDHLAARFAFDKNSGRASLNPEQVLRRLNELDQLKLPIHITGLSFQNNNEDEKAKALENCYRLLFSHPRVEAIFLWGFWERNHWLGHDAALVDNNWNLLPAGKVLRQLLLYEWNTMLDTNSNKDGKILFRGFYGDYKISLDLPSGQRVSGIAHLTPSSHFATITLMP